MRIDFFAQASPRIMRAAGTAAAIAARRELEAAGNGQAGARYKALIARTGAKP